MNIRKTAFFLISISLFAAVLISCDKDDPTKVDTPTQKEPDKPDNPDKPDGPGTNPGGTTATVPDCFVYYQGATFVFKRTLNSETSSKITWEVTAYDSSSGTATVSEKVGDDNPTTFMIRKGSKGIEFNKGSWKSLTDGGSDINFMNGSKLNSKPSGAYGSIVNKTKVETVSVPGGKTSNGFSISSEYQSTAGTHDAFMFGYSSSEKWSTECGFVGSSYSYQDGREYPIFSQQTTIELVAYDIPMPDGSHRSYAPAGATVYDVESTNFSCYQNNTSKQRYACIFGYWNDKRNKDVMRYQLCALWYDNGWQYAQITEATNAKWSFGGWFAGKPYSAYANGGQYDGVKFDCCGQYSSSTGSQSYSPVDQAVYFVLFVLAENSISVGTPDIDNTVFSLLYIPNDGTAASTYSQRVSLLDDGTVSVLAAATTKSAMPVVRPSIPAPGMIEGPVHRLAW